MLIKIRSFQISSRIRNQTEQKRRMVSALKAGVSREGQTLYMAITKMITEVNWSGPNIVVFNDVVITPPYTVDSVNGNPGTRQYTYVKKIVEKHTSTSPDSSFASISGGGMNNSVNNSGSSGTGSVNNSTSSSPPVTASAATGGVSKNSF